MLAGECTMAVELRSTLKQIVILADGFLSRGSRIAPRRLPLGYPGSNLQMPKSSNPLKYMVPQEGLEPPTP